MVSFMTRFTFPHVASSTVVLDNQPKVISPFAIMAAMNFELVTLESSKLQSTRKSVGRCVVPSLKHITLPKFYMEPETFCTLE